MPHLRPQDTQDEETISSAIRDPYTMVDPNGLERLDSETVPASNVGIESAPQRDSES